MLKTYEKTIPPAASAAAEQPAVLTFADFQKRINTAFFHWTGGSNDHVYEQTWPHYSQRCVDALNHAFSLAQPDEAVLVFTSGGTIANICKQVLGFSDEQMSIQMWRIANSSVTRLERVQDRFALTLFNSTAHLDQTGDARLITFT
jgi:broad specificity phosphatase PhoE